MTNPVTTAFDALPAAAQDAARTAADADLLPSLQGQLTIREDHQHVTVERIGHDGRLGHFDPYTGEEVKRATGYPTIPPSFLQPLHGIRLQ